MEFDIYDREEKVFLDTPSRRKFTEQMGIISSVPVLDTGKFRKKEDILAHIGPSNYITENHTEVLKALARRQGLDVDRVLRETDPSTTMEGLYIKVEEGGIVTERLKYVRAEFLQCVFASESHWQSRPIIPNQLVGHTILS